ncbi:MAG TPA: tRNA (adenosine(37)-N6)-dimethylallyltransferase MiaA [bacterium]|nr:tRNA (adenosine(37)-N6)-dimethylallyltransferase MiaA [bacterium]
MVIFILGPTASGKTRVSVELAKEINGEIIGADSVQIYRDLVIGAASPTLEEMEGVPHHLIGTHDLKDEISAGIYADLALDAINDINSRGKVPIIVGGTNFYVDTLINGLSPVPELDDVARKDYNDSLKLFSTEELYTKLLETDPLWAERISSKNDRQRIRRGLEVFELTGKKLSEWNSLERVKKYPGEFFSFAISSEREELYEKINIRSKAIVKSGLVDEVRKVNSMGFNVLNCRPLNSIGYAQADLFIKGIIPSEDELVETIAQNTRHLAKRQMTWLKKMDYVIWKDVCGIVKCVLETVQNRLQDVSKK